MDRWEKQTFRLKADHGWSARPGHQICVLGRSAVRFDFPRGWHMEPGDPSYKFLDHPPPDDDIRLEVSYEHIPPADWEKFPLAGLLADVVADDRP